MRLPSFPRLYGRGILECTSISCGLRLRREPILKPASYRYLVVSLAFGGWWVRTRKKGLETVAGSTPWLVSWSDTTGELSVGIPFDSSWSCTELELCPGLFGSLMNHRLLRKRLVLGGLHICRMCCYPCSCAWLYGIRHRIGWWIRASDGTFDKESASQIRYFNSSSAMTK